MPIFKSVKDLIRASLPALLALLLTGPAVALAEGPPEERLNQLEEQVKALQAALEELRDQQPETPAKEETAREAHLDELERRIDLLASELEDLKIGEAAVVADQSVHGFGPAASKVYRTEDGLSIGGYGEMLYQSFDSSRDDGSPSGATDQLDFLRAIVYFGYKWNDRWLFNSEIEFEHGSTEEDGSVSVEFAYFDYLWKPELNLRAGLVLVPMGFLNELHEPTTFLSAKRPDTERLLIPSTWRENGLGVFGDAGGFSYRTYLVNGFDASGFSAAGLRGGRQNGSESKAEDFAWVGRLDYTGTPGLLAGVSAYVGDAAQDLTGPGGTGLGVRTSILEGHVDWRWRGLELRGLWAQAEVDDAARLNEALGLSGSGSVGEELEGFYLQAGYDVLARSGSGRSLVPFVRWEQLDTQKRVPAGFSRNPARDIESLTLGLAFKPFDRFVLKLDYQDYDNGAGTATDQLNLALGYVF
ncbi:MAG: hypothetical protein KDD47_26410 [Acidobacteria bacterium]|nr:hypothetical protein [Acidobacteriota bacterium]